MNSQSSHTAICQDCYDHFIISRSGSPRSRDVTRQQRGSTWSVPRTLHPCAATHAMNRAGPSQLAKTLTTSSTRFQPPSRQRVAWSNNNQQHSNERPGNYCYFLSSLCFFISITLSQRRSSCALLDQAFPSTLPFALVNNDNQITRCRPSLQAHTIDPFPL